MATGYVLIGLTLLYGLGWLVLAGVKEHTT